MKKLLALALVLIWIVSLCACDSFGDAEYKLIVVDYWGYLVEPLQTYYQAGEEVEVHLAFLSGPSVGIQLNGTYIAENADTKHVDGHPVITFTMPAKDSILYTTQNGAIGFDPTLSRAGSVHDTAMYLYARNADKCSPEQSQHLPIYTFDTLADLEKFKHDFGGESGFDFGWDEVPSLNDATNQYDDAFFAQYTLVLVCIQANSGSYRFGCKDVYADGAAFSVHVEQTNDPQFFTEDMAAWFLTVAVPDAMLADCTTFDAKLITDLTESPEE